MKRKIAALILVLLVAIASYFSWQKLSYNSSNKEINQISTLLNEMETKGIIPFEQKDINKANFSTESLRGKLIFINFWASWCDPCVREFPSMLSLVKHFKGELVLVMISNDENYEDMMSFVNAFNANTENVFVLWDPERKISEKYGTFKLPETFMVGPDLKLIRKIVGVESWFTPNAIVYIDDVIKSYKK